MLVLDLFAGTGSATKAFEDAGHTVIKVEFDEYFEADERNVLDLTAEYILEKYGKPDFIWASPPCQRFSVASLKHYWIWDEKLGKAVPRRPEVFESLNLVEFTLKLISELNPDAWLVENPRGLLRKQDLMLPLTRRTVTYCQYGDTRQKPTDLWGEVPNWIPRPMCRPGATCHEYSPRGTRTGGTQGMGNAKIRSMIPYELGKEIMEALTKEETK